MSPSYCWSRRGRIVWISDSSSRTAAVADVGAAEDSAEMGAAVEPHPGRVMLAQYVQIANEEMPANPDSCVAVLEALLAVRSLRTDRGGGLDRIYLGNLGVPVATVFSEHQFDAEFLSDAVGDLIQNLQCPTVFPKDVVFARRSLYFALREEAVTDIVALNIRLVPLLGTLFRLAARGHWFRERQPLRMPGLPQNAHAFPPAAPGPFQIAASVEGDGELELHLTMHNGGVRYPIGPYSEIRDFEVMLDSLQPGQRWHGVHFSASSPAVTTEGRPIVHFWRRADFIEFHVIRKTGTASGNCSGTLW
jgi:hypothetical protein